MPLLVNQVLQPPHIPSVNPSEPFCSICLWLILYISHWESSGDYSMLYAAALITSSSLVSTVCSKASFITSSNFMTAWLTAGLFTFGLTH